jgi:hypothetical protein
MSLGAIYLMSLPTHMNRAGWQPADQICSQKDQSCPVIGCRSIGLAKRPIAIIDERLVCSVRNTPAGHLGGETIIPVKGSSFMPREDGADTRRSSRKCKPEQVTKLSWWRIN